MPTDPPWSGPLSIEFGICLFKRLNYTTIRGKIYSKYFGGRMEQYGNPRRHENAPERHSFRAALAVNRRPTLSKAFCTRSNSEFRMPAAINTPFGCNRATNRSRSAIKRFE